MESMTEADIEILLQRTHELYPEAKPRLITDNGPCYRANDFKSFVRQVGMTHVRTSPFYPHSNGKVERFHGTLKTECIRPHTPLSLDEAFRVVDNYIHHYNTEPVHSAIGWVTQEDRF